MIDHFHESESSFIIASEKVCIKDTKNLFSLLQFSIEMIYLTLLSRPEPKSIISRKENSLIFVSSLHISSDAFVNNRSFMFKETFISRFIQDENITSKNESKIWYKILSNDIQNEILKSLYQSNYNIY